MVVPSLLAGVEEPCRRTGLRVYHGDFWSLILIAVGASKAQIVKQSATSMSDWDDVIDLEHGRLSAIANIHSIALLSRIHRGAAAALVSRGQTSHPQLGLDFQLRQHSIRAHVIIQLVPFFTS